MMDIENIEKKFDNYVSQFNPNDGRIRLKIEHIKRVANISRTIATKLNLNEEHIKLAETIGYFHDIGRFMQAKIYNTFSDKDSVNHAELSAKVLFEDNLIQKFNIDKKYYDIIKIAILNHNKAKIEDGLNEEEMLFAKLIRDADKIDIFYIICEYDFESIFWYKEFDCDKISDVIMDQFINEHLINYKDIKSNADQIATFYAYIYDFYFDFSLSYLKSKKYLEIFTNRIIENFKSDKIHEQVNELLQISNGYLAKF